MENNRDAATTTQTTGELVVSVDDSGIESLRWGAQIACVVLGNLGELAGPVIRPRPNFMGALDRVKEFFNRALKEECL